MLVCYILVVLLLVNFIRRTIMKHLILLSLLASTTGAALHASTTVGEDLPPSYAEAQQLELPKVLVLVSANNPGIAPDLARKQLGYLNSLKIDPDMPLRLALENALAAKKDELLGTYFPNDDLSNFAISVVNYNLEGWPDPLSRAKILKSSYQSDFEAYDPNLLDKSAVESGLDTLVKRLSSFLILNELVSISITRK